MPSANKTSLGLNQWQANEYPKMADFNEDNRIIDQKLTELQSGSGVKIYTITELSEPQEGKIYNVKITQNTSVINGKSVYKENTTQSVTLKAGKVATVYYQSGSFFYKASASGNATSSDVLAGKKFSNDDDTDITGTMVNRGATIITPSTSNKYIASGYHNGSGYVVGDSDLVASNIVQGKNIFGVSGQALQYQQSEKDAIANALTSKGVPTSTTASWATIEQNIRNILFAKRHSKTLNLTQHINYQESYHGENGATDFYYHIYLYDLNMNINDYTKKIFLIPSYPDLANRLRINRWDTVSSEGVNLVDIRNLNINTKYVVAPKKSNIVLRFFYKMSAKSNNEPPDPFYNTISVNFLEVSL